MSVKKFFASIMICFVVFSSFFGVVSFAAGGDNPEPNIDYILKTAGISTDDPRNVIIEVDAQYEAIPRPKILFWQANLCYYHGLTTNHVVSCLNAALQVADVDYYIEAFKSHKSSGSNYLSDFYQFEHGSVLTSDNIPSVNQTGFHTVTQNNLKHLLQIWNEAETNGDPYDYLIILYDGLVASGAPSSNNFWEKYTYPTGYGINLTDEEYRERVDIATQLSKIPTMHLTPALLTVDSNYGHNNGYGDDVAMYLDRISYWDSSVNGFTYRSYAESVADYAIVPGVDYTKYGPHSNHRLTTTLMLNSLAFINPDYYLSLVDTDSNSPTYGQFRGGDSFVPPSAEDFSAHMPAYHSYVADDLPLQVQRFITVGDIAYNDKLVPGLTYNSAEFYYSEARYDDEGETEWIRIPDSDVTLTVTGDSASGTNVHAVIRSTDPTRSYYSHRIKMVINTTASPDLGIDGNLVDTNVGNATVDYHSIDNSILFHQNHETPQVRWDIYDVSYDMGEHGSLNDPVSGLIYGDSALPYEVCKEGYSPRRVIGDSVEDSNVTINPGYYLAGFTCDKPVLIRGENTMRPTGSVIDVDDVNSIVVREDIVLKAVYEADKNVHYVQGDHGTITGITTETVRENRNPSGTTVVPDEDYAHTGFTANVDVVLNDGTTYAAGELIPLEDVTSVKIKEDTIFTAKYARLYVVNYDAADHGTFTANDLSDNYASEVVAEGSNPTYGTDDSLISKIYREGGYVLTGFVCDKDVQIEGESGVRTAGSVITESDITKIIVENDITLTAQYVYSVDVPTGVRMGSGSDGWYIAAITCIGLIGTLGSAFVRRKNRENES